MDKEIRAVDYPVEVRAEGDKKKIVGYAVKWEQLSVPLYGMFRERFRRGAFAESLATTEVVATYQHNATQTLGRTNKTLIVVEDDIGLRYEIDPPSWAGPIMESIERGDVKGASFTFRATKDEWDETDPKMALRTITTAALAEVSPVTFPAYPTSEAGVRSAQETYEKRPKPARTAEYIDQSRRNRLKLAERGV